MRRSMIASFVTVALVFSLTEAQTLEERAETFIDEYNVKAEEQYFQSVTASWNYNTNLTDETAQIVQNQAKLDAAFTLEWGTRAKKEFSSEMDQLSEYYYRQIQSIQVLGTANLNDAKQDQYNNITTRMDRVYSTSCVAVGSECLPLEPDLTEIMRSSRDYIELKNVWKGWFEAVGQEIKDDYANFVALSNEAYQADGYSDTGEFWRSWYETDDFEALLEDLWQELRPMYLELHAFVRRKLYETYGNGYVNLNGPIPSHLLGNMWAQTWGNIYDLVEPFPGKSSVDATPSMIEQNYDAMRMFKTSEEFFTSLGLLEMTEKFWNLSMIEKPQDRDVVCHASAWDFYASTKDDFRIKQCTTVNMEDLITVHHEMGHIQYFQQYSHQDVVYRAGANPGFHEAVGDTLALSVSTPAHLEEIGLLESVEEDDEADINYLMSQALEKIAFLPFGYMIDKWRWSVFDGRTPKSEYQSEWDRLRLLYQGITPPVVRDQVKDFDPGAKYHIPGNTPYIRYFVSFVVQFQFYKAMCEKAGHTGPLYKCDFYRSTEAGTALGDMLKLGSSKKWPVAMEQLTGSPDMSTAALQEYFKPLTDWLKKQNEMNGETLGWDGFEDWRPSGYYPVSDVATFLFEQNSTGEEAYYKGTVGEWNYATNITPQTLQEKENQSQALANFKADQSVEAQKFDLREIEDENDARLLKKMGDAGLGALSPEDLQARTEAVSSMGNNYNEATVCGIDGKEECVPLDPDLTELMATSRNYNTLRQAWKGWRDSIAKKGATRQTYEQYVELSNKAAELNGHEDMGRYWLAAYETPNFDDQLERVWQEVLPLYVELHAYVRRKLFYYYGPEVINLEGPIPAHILGNMWAQDWSSIYDIVEPFRGKAQPSADEALQTWTIDRMFETADQFFSDLGLEAVPQAFWDESMLEKPTDGRKVECHASAWDFYNRKDFRIKMCTTKTQRDFITIHHELGHIQYYLQYDDLHVAFRDGANPGFHEAVGDTLSLSVSTLEHMNKVGLIEDYDDDEQSNINYLMSQALDSIAFLPFGYLIDKYRWDVFSGRIDSRNMNQGWWDYRIKYQGVTPPVDRTEEDFDPAAKFHVSQDVPYIRYFVSAILRYQFYEAMCAAADYSGPLHKCDFDGDKNAGAKFAEMLKLGSSEPWETALEQLTGSREMSSGPLLEYYDDLMVFLKNENNKYRDVSGWPDYSWQPPTNTIVQEDNTVVLDDGNGGSTTTSSLLFMTSLLWMAFYFTRV